MTESELRPYHLKICEFKRVEPDGVFKQYARHVCGLSGFDSWLGDECPGCTEAPVLRPPRCTCGLRDLFDKAKIND